MPSYYTLYVDDMNHVSDHQLQQLSTPSQPCHLHCLPHPLSLSHIILTQITHIIFSIIR